MWWIINVSEWLPFTTANYNEVNHVNTTIVIIINPHHDLMENQMMSRHPLATSHNISSSPSSSPHALNPHLNHYHDLTVSRNKRIRLTKLHSSLPRRIRSSSSEELTPYTPIMESSPVSLAVHRNNFIKDDLQIYEDGTTTTTTGASTTPSSPSPRSSTSSSNAHHNSWIHTESDDPLINQNSNDHEVRIYQLEKSVPLSHELLFWVLWRDTVCWERKRKKRRKGGKKWADRDISATGIIFYEKLTWSVNHEMIFTAILTILLSSSHHLNKRKREVAKSRLSLPPVPLRTSYKKEGDKK